MQHTSHSLQRWASPPKCTVCWDATIVLQLSWCRFLSRLFKTWKLQPMRVCSFVVMTIWQFYVVLVYPPVCICMFLIHEALCQLSALIECFTYVFRIACFVITLIVFWLVQSMTGFCMYRAALLALLGLLHEAQCIQCQAWKSMCSAWKLHGTSGWLLISIG